MISKVGNVSWLQPAIAAERAKGKMTRRPARRRCRRKVWLESVLLVIFLHIRGPMHYIRYIKARDGKVEGMACQDI